MYSSRTVTALLTILTATSIAAQGDTLMSTRTAHVDSLLVPSSELEERPSFPGGEAALMRYLATEAQYPDSAVDAGISGKVYMQFVVEKDGSIGGVMVKKGVHPSLDAEAVRLVKSMPIWTPGRMDGQPVRVQFIIPIGFELQ